MSGIETGQAAFEERDALLRDTLAETAAPHRSVVRLGEARDQAEAILDRTGDTEGTKDLTTE